MTFGNSVIEILPDFIGYILMVNGLTEMAGEGPLFIRVKPYAVGMAAYTGILFFMDTFGVWASPDILAVALGVLSAVVALYISYSIIMGIKAMEERYGTSLNADSLKTTWIVLAITNAAVYLFRWVPGMAMVCLLASAVMAIGFLICFNTSKRLYYAMKGQMGKTLY